jgi:transcriptional regulator with XRE-family HTH domain
MESLGTRIKTARQTKKVTQSELATAIGVSDKTVSAYESGRIDPPLDVLKKIATSTNHTMRYFVGHDEESSILEKLTSIEKLFTEIRDLLKTKSRAR